MLLKAKWILPISSQPIYEGAIKVKSGVIANIGRSHDLIRKYPIDKIIDLGNSIIMPGVINAHSHIAYTAFENSLKNLSFITWLNCLRIIKENIFDDEAFYVSSFMGALRCIRYGVTTIADTCDAIEPFIVSKEIGLRIIFFKELFGWAKTEAKKNLSSAIKAITILKNYCTPLQTIGISPHSPYTVSPFLLNLLSSRVKKLNLPVCMHVAESEQEHKFFTEQNGLLKLLMDIKHRKINNNYKSVLSYLHSTNFLELNPILIHGCYLLKSDMKILQKFNLSVVYCPSSNIYFKHRTTPLHWLSNYNIKWGIGTDSVASNYKFDLFNEIKQINRMPSFKGITAEQLLSTITIGNACILNLDNKIGSLEIGKDADIIAISLNKEKITNENELYQLLLNKINGKNVIFTMVKGKILYYNNNFLFPIPNTIYTKYEKLKKEIKFFAKNLL